MHPEDHAVPLPILYSSTDPPKTREEVQADLALVAAAGEAWKIKVPADQYETARNLKRKYKGGKRRRVW